MKDCKVKQGENKMNDKSGLEKMMEWLEAWIGEKAEYVSIENVYDKARSLLAEEKAQEKRPCKVMPDLCDNCDGTGSMRGMTDIMGNRLDCPVCDGTKTKKPTEGLTDTDKGGK